MLICNWLLIITHAHVFQHNTHFCTPSMLLFSSCNSNIAMVLLGPNGSDAQVSRLQASCLLLLLMTVCPVLSMVQVCSQQSCHSFDLQHGLLEPHMKGLLELLQDKHTVKVMHDCRQPAASLLYQKGITIQNVFDTQVLPTQCMMWDTCWQAPQPCSSMLASVILHVRSLCTALPWVSTQCVSPARSAVHARLFCSSHVLRCRLFKVCWTTCTVC